MSYTSTNGMFTYTITNNTNYVIEQLDYDIILSTFNRWESLVTIDSRFGSSYTITISYVIDTLDTGILGGASITNSAYVGSHIYGNVIPSTANITMNNTYLYGLKTTIRNDGFSSYYHVLLHEIGHILGIGSFWYLTGCPKTSYNDNGTTKYYYTGTNALREYNSCFAGFSNDAFLGIPIEDDGGAGTAGVHPEEGSEGGISADNRYINGIFHPGLDTELMTGWLDGTPVSTPLSRITLGFLEDMGYTVNYNLADVYIMSWLAQTDANNLEQTYIQGFLDVSGGNMINRSGNLSVLDGTMDVSGDVTFDSKLSVGGDVSFNGTTIDICGNLYAQYPINSIPATAINGQVEATPNFSGDVDFQSNVDISDNLTVRNKVAIGKTTLGTEALDVSGNINFSGNLYNGGVLFTGGGNVFDSGDVSMNSNLAVGGQIAMGGHIHPTANAAYDLGNASYKIRHLFLSDNSLWVGDDHKVDVGGGKMKFKKRNKNAVPASIVAALVNGEAIDAAAHITAAKTHSTKSTLDAITLNDWLAYAKTLGGDVGGTPSADISIQDIYGNSNDADYESIQNADNTGINQLTINQIDETVDVKGIQALDQYLTFTIPLSMTELKYFCISHSAMIGDFEIGDYSATETDKTYYVRLVPTDPMSTPPYYIFSNTVNGTALNTAVTGSGSILKLYKGNTYKFIKTDNGHPFMVGDSWKVTTGIKLESTGDGTPIETTYTDPYPLHVNGTANIEKNLNVANKLTVSGPIIQW